MLSAISRYGARFVPGFEAIVDSCRRRGDLVEGPRIRDFEEAFARRLGGGHAVATSYGRMAAYYILKALELPEGSEVVFPALTFWVVPEILFQSAPCFSATARYIAHRIDAGELMVIETVVFSRSMPSNRISMSSSESIATPHLPTSPSLKG